MSPGMSSPAWETSCDLCIGIHSRLSPLFKLAGIKSVFENQSLLLQTWKGIVELNSARKGVVLWLARPFMCVRPDYNNLKLLLNSHQMEYGTKLALKRCCWAVCSFFNKFQVAPVETISLLRSPGIWVHGNYYYRWIKTLQNDWIKWPSLKLALQPTPCTGLLPPPVTTFTCSLHKYTAQWTYHSAFDFHLRSFGGEAEISSFNHRIKGQRKKSQSIWLSLFVRLTHVRKF